MKREAVVGCLLGTAVGDALGLPYEGLSPRRARKLFPDTSQHHLLFGKGMVSDDTEHAAFVARALLDADGDVDRFRRRLARALRWWLLGLPAGVGFATLRAIIRLWLGIAPEKSGVFSAGNGAAMRAPILGVALGDDVTTLQTFVGASTAITHRDPKAYYAALAVALAAWQSAQQTRPTAGRFSSAFRELAPEAEADELNALIECAAASAEARQPLPDFAQSIGSAKGISGYSYHTVPCVLQQWFRDPDDFEGGLQALICAGGDTDTTAAIFGGIVGARVGETGIPAAWREGIAEWPRSLRCLQALGTALADRHAAPRYFLPGVLLRNGVFLAVVLAHGFRRLLPPW